MKQALLVLGVPESKLDRKSVVSSEIARPSWLGGNAIKVIKAFNEPPPVTGWWLNEGTCGVDTDDKQWRYYDLAGTNSIGKGGWDSPTDATDGNLWLEPTPTTHGPVMHECGERYGTWPNQNVRAYEPTELKDWVKQIKVCDAILNGNNVTVSYRTEGVKNIGKRVVVTIEKIVGGNPTEVAQQDASIAQEWDNLQQLTFAITEAGEYKAKACIVDDTGNAWAEWIDDDGKAFTKN